MYLQVTRMLKSYIKNFGYFEIGDNKIEFLTCSTFLDLNLQQTNLIATDWSKLCNGDILYRVH